MQNNKWVPQVLKDVEKYCHENALPEVAFCLEEARLKFRLSQEEKSTVLSGLGISETVQLVWSQPEKQAEVAALEVEPYI